jgi:hypothetical protein
MKVKRAEGFLSVGPFLWSRPFSAYPVSLITSKCTRRSYVMGRKLDQGIKGGEGNQKPEGRPKQPFIASNGQRYALFGVGAYSRCPQAPGTVARMLLTINVYLFFIKIKGFRT